jgi:hypothetical protein
MGDLEQSINCILMRKSIFNNFAKPDKEQV